METTKEERRDAIMKKLTKKQMADMLDHAMQENMNWEAEYSHLSVAYEKLNSTIKNKKEANVR